MGHEGQENQSYALLIKGLYLVKHARMESTEKGSTIYSHAQLPFLTSCCLSIWPPEGPLRHPRAFAAEQSSRAERDLLQAICDKAVMGYTLQAAS